LYSEVFHLIMKKIVSIIVTLIFCFSLFIPYSSATTDKKNEITIVIPEKVVAKFINDVLPIEITRPKGYSGVIWVKSIDKLKLGINKVSFSVNMCGKDVKYTAKIGNLSTILNLGNIDISFNCEASIRYDKEKNILYMRPKIMEKGNGNELLWPLLAILMNDKEYPVEIQKLKPIITEFSSKTATINMDISDVYITNNRLFIGIRPTLEKNSK